LVTNLVSAQLLVILSQVDGLYSDGGRGPVIPTVEVGSSIDQHIGSDISETGVGGMAAKALAARLASHWGVPTIIASGLEPGLLERAVLGEEVQASGVPLYTDARHYSAAGVPTVLYGAGPRTLDEARGHRADENLCLEDLHRATEVVALSLLDLLAAQA